VSAIDDRTMSGRSLLPATCQFATVCVVPAAMVAVAVVPRSSSM
jgi:hypothetical protein